MPGASPSQVAIKLSSITYDALRGMKPRDRVRAFLSNSLTGEPLASFIASLIGSIDGYRGSAALMMAASESVLVGCSEAERAALFHNTANIAHELGDLATEIASRQESIYAQRLSDETPQSKQILSTMLYRLATLYEELGDFPSATSLLEEVAMLDSETQHPDKQQHHIALEEAKQRSAGATVSKIHDSIIDWRDGSRDVQGLAKLLNVVIAATADTLRSGDEEERNALAEDLALLRAAGPLRIIGMEDFLHVLQLWLRDEPGMAQKAKALQRALPKEFMQKLLRVKG